MLESIQHSGTALITYGLHSATEWHLEGAAEQVARQGRSVTFPRPDGSVAAPAGPGCYRAKMLSLSFTDNCFFLNLKQKARLVVTG